MYTKNYYIINIIYKLDKNGCIHVEPIRFTETRSFLKVVIVLVIAAVLITPIAFLLVTDRSATGTHLIASTTPSPEPNNPDPNTDTYDNGKTDDGKTVIFSSGGGSSSDDDGSGEGRQPNFEGYWGIVPNSERIGSLTGDLLSLSASSSSGMINPFLCMRGHYEGSTVHIRFQLENNPFEGLLSYDDWTITDDITGSSWREPDELFICYFLWNDEWHWIFGDCYGMDDYVDTEDQYDDLPADFEDFTELLKSM